jgi:hypothetical protein
VELERKQIPVIKTPAVPAATLFLVAVGKAHRAALLLRGVLVAGVAKQLGKLIPLDEVAHRV